MDGKPAISPPEVSIIMAVFNREFSLVKRALDSVMLQNFQNLEIIVVDDGSNAHTSIPLLNYAIEEQEKVTYLRHANVGQAESVNRGVALSKAPFIGLIDSDDEYKPGHVSQCLKYMKKGYDLIASVPEINAKKPEHYFVPDKYNLKRDIHIKDCIIFGSLFGKREVFSSVKFKDIYSLDSDFFERAGEKYKTVKPDLQTYIYYSGTPGGITERQRRLRNIS